MLSFDLPPIVQGYGGVFYAASSAYDHSQGRIDVAGDSGSGLLNFGSNLWYSTEMLGIEVYMVSASTVPVPAAAWLLGSALLGLVGIKRKG